MVYFLPVLTIVSTRFMDMTHVQTSDKIYELAMYPLLVFFLDHLEENYLCNNYHSHFLALAAQQLWWQHDFTQLMTVSCTSNQLTSTLTRSAVTHTSLSLSHMHTHIKHNRGLSVCLLCLFLLSSFFLISASSSIFLCQLSLPASSYSSSSLINVSRCSCSVLPHSFTH